MPARPPTKPSTPKLSEIARRAVAPKGAVSTGWPSVRDKCKDLGVTFRPWQHPTGQLILAKRADGKYAATIGGTGLSIPRQVGKTFLVGMIVFALCLLCPRLTVIWTSHRLRTSEETFKKMLAISRRKKIAPHMLRPVLGSGEEAIRFRNGSRILFGARERGFGRGFDEVDVLIFDEAQILTDAALDDMIPATNQSRQPAGALLLFMGTPPKPTDPGEVFSRMRADAKRGDEDTGWVEFGADQDYSPPPTSEQMTAADWEQVAKANPSFPEDTPREAILRMRKKLGPDSYRREGLGIWDDDDAPSILPRWHRRAVKDLVPPSPLAIGLAVSLDEEWGSIAACTMLDGDPVLGAVDRRKGSEWIVAEAKRIQDELRCAVVVDEKCPDKALLTALTDAKVDLTVAKLEDYVEACSELRNRVKDGGVTHLATDELDAAVKAAQWRPVGDGRKVLGRNKSEGNVDMLEAAVMALHGAFKAVTYDPLDSIL